MEYNCDKGSNPTGDLWPHANKIGRVLSHQVLKPALEPETIQPAYGLASSHFLHGCFQKWQ
eukprot:12787051-Alexandrium_andersonii.AAC.1